ncbi:uncharacterized protein BDW47DRAFT_43306 [Aspergillus candidus]|uniref:Uncharacterized protein n=1 Tax=Aspergillus candidus TaxID=41067 RepID=A0A2I2FMZ5_ASPCN|nr:hypothetical protein BDW47DRAFT_43306 [Aspergillus candidus]PLB41967.1 hypothetical protein BDW47DRAFT_43306 [Aspergillus candidus]
MRLTNPGVRNNLLFLRTWLPTDCLYCSEYSMPFLIPSEMACFHHPGQIIRNKAGNREDEPPTYWYMAHPRSRGQLFAWVSIGRCPSPDTRWGQPFDEPTLSQYSTMPVVRYTPKQVVIPSHLPQILMNSMYWDISPKSCLAMTFISQKQSIATGKTLQRNTIPPATSNSNAASCRLCNE